MGRTKKVDETKVETTENLEDVKTENTDKTEESEEMTSTGETSEDLKGDGQTAPTETDKSLKVQIAFTDKYTGEEYPVGHVLENLSEERYNELINDPRKLVCKNY